jgi:NAD(P)-dependent dehydrogenase (short-subunit alcohol dehydrogenase family)
VLASLVSADLRVRHVLPGKSTRSLGGDRYEANFQDADSLRSLHELLAGPHHAIVGCLINFLGLSDAVLSPAGSQAQAALETSLATFHLLKEFEADLDSSARQGGGLVLNLSGMGGSFGIDAGPTTGLAAAGTLGIIKTFRREYPKTTAKNVDVDPTLDFNLLSARIVQELTMDDGVIEVGLTRQGRQRLKLVHTEPTGVAPLSIGPESVVVVTGGAYGVTADVAIELARRTRCRMVLVGRSTLPDAEPAETASLDLAGLRQWSIKQAKAEGKKILPAEIEKSVQRTLRNRIILGSIDRFRTAGSNVEYHAVDARREDSFGKLLDDLYARFGRIDGVIHGAGVIDDKRIKDKSTESFTSVFSTKVDSAQILANHLRPDSLRFLVFFSSVSGRFGNAGQADYSAANEFLNKLADDLGKRWPARVASINWGPWDGGMVSDELRRLYAQVGYDLIPIDVGASYFCQEIALPPGKGAEVTVSGSVAKMADPTML